MKEQQTNKLSYEFSRKLNIPQKTVCENGKKLVKLKYVDSTEIWIYLVFFLIIFTPKLI